jgi:hypothetical protein
MSKYRWFERDQRRGNSAKSERERERERETLHLFIWALNVPAFEWHSPVIIYDLPIPFEWAET